jgi:hypothetical protein
VGVALHSQPVAGSLDELLEGATSRQPFLTSDSKSGSSFERVVIDGERYVVKHVHVDHDWTMRGFGDLGCRPVLVWRSGLLAALPPSIDHAVVGAAVGEGRNGWGAALLLHDVSDVLVPEGDEPLGLEQHRRFLDHLADLAVAFWGWEDVVDLLPLENRWAMFGPGCLAAERALGWPEVVPRIADDGWQRFAERAPADVADVVQSLRQDLDPLVVAVRRTPQTFMHGDWKLGNVGARPAPDGRTVLIDWSYPGAGPVAHDLAWYLALNRARLPESKEDAIAALGASLAARGIALDGWWDQQVALCLLGALVQLGWEKALGDEDELGWWCDRAREGARLLA